MKRSRSGPPTPGRPGRRSNRARQTSRGVVLRAREQLEQVNGRLFGAVLNAAQVRRGGYFREQIRTFYDYQPEDMLVTDAKRALPPGGKTDEDATEL